MRFGFALGVATLAVLISGEALSARALVARMPTVPEKVAGSETVIVGKVVAIEEMVVKASPFPGSPEKVDYTVANIRIETGVLGARGLTNVRVGFQAVGEPMNRPLRPIRPQFNMSLKLGQEAIFFLAPHHDADFVIMPNLLQPIEKSAEGYARQLDLVKKLAQMVEKPVEALKAGQASDRLLAAGVLVYRYRRAVPNRTKQEAIPAEENRLILKALAEADWTANDANAAFTARSVFGMLGVGAEHGFTPPRPARGTDYTKAYNEAAQAWLRSNGERFAIKRYVK